MILPLVLYGCKTWSLTFREEHRLRVFENRVLRRIFGPKRDEVMGGWRKMHNEALHNLYSSPSIIRFDLSKITIVTIVYNRLQLLELIRGYDYGEFDGMKSRRMKWAEHVA
jgi:hypothetical protein